jgi:RNA-directed DNA polymerase
VYENCLELDDDLAPLLGGRDPVLLHGGGPKRLLRVHERHAALAASGQHPDLPPIKPLLFRRLADARTMMSACRDLLARGPKAPGLNGYRLEHLDNTELWSLCRATAKAIRQRTYKPGGDRKVPIPKEGKPGQFRELTIQNAEDRVVGRAVVRILQPLVDPGFSPFSFGFRPRRGTHSALATALTLAQAQQRWVWVSDDVAKAFDQIPFNRFLDACRMHFPPDVVEFISLIGHTGKGRGLRQGSPASPLFANIFFDHHLDRPWHAGRPDQPLFRYADDLLLLCGTENDALSTYDSLAQRATAIGTSLKGSRDSSIHDLSSGNWVDWLGYRIGLEAGRATVRVGERAWSRLGFQLAKAHLLPASPIRATQIIRGWLTYLGPCLAHEDRPAVLARLRKTASVFAFDEIPDHRQLGGIWSAAHARWSRLSAAEAAKLPSRLQRLGRQVENRSSPGFPSELNLNTKEHCRE